MKKTNGGPKKKGMTLNPAQLKKLLFLAVAFFALAMFNRTFAFVGLFTVVTSMAKWMRTKLGLNMIVFDPLLFFALLIMKFYGYKSLFIFVTINTLVMDAPTGNMQVGSFANWFLYQFCPWIAYTVFVQGMGMGFFGYGNIGSFLYSFLYMLQKLTILPGDPFDSFAKSLTSLIFTFLYIALFGGIFEFILSL